MSFMSVSFQVLFVGNKYDRNEEVTLYNVPNISDTKALIDIIELLNGKVEYKDEIMKIVDLNPVLFREYDLRGIVGELIDENVAYTLGVNYGSYVQDLGIHMVVIGHDNRLLGHEFCQIVAALFEKAGVKKLMANFAKLKTL